MRALSRQRLLVLPGYWYIILVTLTLPLEISALLFPIWQHERLVDGRLMSVISFGRLATAIAAASVVYQSIKWRKVTLPRSRIGIFAGLLFLDYLLSLVISPVPTRVAFEIVRLAIHFLFWIATVRALKSPDAILKVVRVLTLTGLALGLLGIYQFVTGRLLWNLFFGGIQRARVNATFVDPNIFGRFLGIAIVFGFVPRQGKGVHRSLGYATALVCLSALLFTGGRGSWLALMAAMAGFIWWSRSYSRLRVLAPVGGIAIVAILVMNLLPVVRIRFSSFFMGTQALGVRIYLIQAGWRMFVDHILLGTGLGGYQEAILTDYSHYIWAGSKVTLSHTSLITIAAELGLVGLLVTFGLFASAFRSFRAALGSSSQQCRSLALATWLGVIVLFVSSQSEGRLYEDPYLWLFLGLLVAIQRVAWAPGRGSTSSCVQGDQ